MACIVREKAPEINACEAMTAATADKPTSGYNAHAGAIRKKGLAAADGSTMSKAP